MKNRRVVLAIIIKGMISCLIIGWLLVSVDFPSLWSAISSADVSLLVVGFGLMLAKVAIAGCRWSLIAWRSGLPLRAKNAFLIFWESLFFSSLLPSSMGGDVWRVYRTTLIGKGTAVAVHSVFLDRLSGAFALVLIILFGSLGAAALATAVDYRVLMVAAAMAGLIVLGLVVLTAVKPVLGRLTGRRVFDVAYTMASHISDTLSDRFVVVAAVLLALFGHLLTVVAAWCIILALSMPVSLLDCLLVIPVALLFSMIPITIGGWGIREGVVTAGLLHLGASNAEAVTVSLLFGGYIALLAATGAGVLLIRNLTRGPAGDADADKSGLAASAATIRDWRTNASGQ